MKIMENSENIKFSSRILSRALVFIEKLQIFMKIMKLMKNTENIKFSIKMPYRLVPLPEKLCIFHSSIEELQISRKITNFSENEQI